MIPVQQCALNRGAKSALAPALGIPRQHPNQWWAGAKKPSGEPALRLLEWVTQAERINQKQKNPWK